MQYSKEEERRKLIDVIDGGKDSGKPYGTVITTYGNFYWFRRTYLKPEEVQTRLSIYRQNYDPDNLQKFRAYLKRRHGFPSYWLGDYGEVKRMYPIYYGYFEVDEELKTKLNEINNNGESITNKRDKRKQKHLPENK